MKTVLTQKEIVESVLEIPETVSIDELFNLSRVTLRDVLYIITHDCDLTDLELRELVSRCIGDRFKNLFNVPPIISKYPIDWKNNNYFKRFVKTYFNFHTTVENISYQILDEIYYYWSSNFYCDKATADIVNHNCYIPDVIKDFIKEKSDL